MGLGWIISGIPHREYVPPDASNTNNVAEYRALLRVLEAVQAMPHIMSLRVKGDSQLVCAQVSGEYNVNATHLIPFHAAAMAIIRQLTDRGCAVSVRWIARADNDAADRENIQVLLDNGVTPTRRHPSEGFVATLTELGDTLSISARSAGKLLTEVGLRVGVSPTEQALSDGYADKRFDGYGVRIDWHLERCASVIHEASSYPAERRKRKQKEEHTIRAEERIKYEEEERAGIEVLRVLVRDRLAANPSLTPLAAVTTTVEDPRLRPPVMQAIRGWWLHKWTKGLSPNVPSEQKKLASVTAKFDVQAVKLLRKKA